MIDVRKAKVKVTTKARISKEVQSDQYLYLRDFTGEKQFRVHCRKLFPDELFPHIVLEEWEHIPEILRMGGNIHPNLFRLIQYVCAIDPDDREGFNLWLSYNWKQVAELPLMDLVRKYLALYHGKYNDIRDFAWYHAFESMGLSEQELSVFDLESYGKSLLSDRYDMVQNHVFLKGAIKKSTTYKY